MIFNFVYFFKADKELNISGNKSVVIIEKRTQKE